MTNIKTEVTFQKGVAFNVNKQSIALFLVKDYVEQEWAWLLVYIKDFTLLKIYEYDQVQSQSMSRKCNVVPPFSNVASDMPYYDYLLI